MSARHFRAPERVPASTLPYMAQVYEHDCPYCHAKRGFRCVTPKGRAIRGPHMKRFSMLYAWQEQQPDRRF